MSTKKALRKMRRRLDEMNAILGEDYPALAIMVETNTTKMVYLDKRVRVLEERLRDIDAQLVDLALGAEFTDEALSQRDIIPHGCSI